MAEVAGYERLLGEVFRPGAFSPPLSTSAAGAYVAASAFFPAGHYHTAGGDPNQLLRWGTATSVPDSQGAGVVVPCVPGQEYTASAYVVQGLNNPLQAAITDMTLGDTFQRDTSNGWGTAGAGGAWSVAGGVGASEYSTVSASTGGTGVVTHTTINAARYTYIGAQLMNASQVVTVSTPEVASGSEIRVGLLSRYIDTNNYYRALIYFNTDQTVDLTIQSRVAGSVTTLATTTTAFTHTANTEYSLRFETSGADDQGRTGTTLTARMWLAGTPEPSLTWQVTYTDTSTDLVTPGAIGTMSFLNVGNTNTLPFATPFKSYLVYTATQIDSTVANLPLAWTRLSITFTATQPSHTFAVLVPEYRTVVPSMTGMDNVQLEQAASASAFATTGAVVYPVMRNYAERWPRQYAGAGFEGYTQVPCVDGFAAINAITLQTECREAILYTDPDYYWPLADGTDSTVYLPAVAQVTNTTLVNVSSKYGTGTLPAPGATMTITGDPGGTGITFTPGAGGIYDAITVIGCGVGTDVPGFAFPPAIVDDWGLSISAWVTLTSTGNTQCVARLYRYIGTDILTLDIYVDASGSPFVEYNYAGYTLTVTTSVYGTNIFDGSPHLLVSSLYQVDGGDTEARICVDGTTYNGTATTASLGGLPSTVPTTFIVGGDIIGGYAFSGCDGIIAHVGLWNRQLSSAEVADLWNAGNTGYSGETTGTRVTRHLTRGGYTGLTRISTGQSTLQEPTWTGTINLLTDCQDTAVVEQGTIWMAPDGVFVFEDRNARFLRLTSSYTLGEDVANGEIPYVGDIAMDLDPQFVYSDVRITRNNFGIAVGGTQDDIAAAARRYFPRSYQASVDLSSNSQAQDEANWIFNTHKQALLRIAAITLNPAGNLSLWRVALSLLIGMRITVVRRATAANQGAGLTVSGEFFVEQVTHDNINIKAGEWTTTLYVSPIGSASAGATFQPWILGDATYGVLGTTTVLGW